MNDFLAMAPLGEPDLRSILVSLRDEILSSAYCSLVGRIISFDAAQQRAEVEINLRRAVYNQTQTNAQKLQLTPTVVAYPVLVDVPVFVLSGGLGSVTLPVAAGDDCLVLFHDRDLDAWWDTGAPSVPNSARMHDLSDGFALVGFRPSVRSLAGYDTDGAAVRHGASKFKVKNGGGQVVLDADLTATSAHGGTVTLNADFAAQSSSGGVIKARAKLDLHNGATSLKSVLDQLCDALTAWVDTHGDTPNPATLAAIAAVKTLSDSLLE